MAYYPKYEVKSLSRHQHDVLTGLLLGDGHISRPGSDKSQANLMVSRSAKDKEYLLWNAEVFKEYLSERSIRETEIPSGNVIRLQSLRNPVFTEYHTKWYSNGKKIVPSDLVLNSEIVKVWFADDGSVNKTRKNERCRWSFRVRISTQSFKKKEVSELCTKLNDLIGVHFYVVEERKPHSINKTQYLLRLNKIEECKKFFDFINDGFPLRRKSDIWNDVKNGFTKPPRIKIPLPYCPSCNSENTRKYGLSRKHKKQRYQCVACGRQITHNNNLKFSDRYV